MNVFLQSVGSFCTIRCKSNSWYYLKIQACVEQENIIDKKSIKGMVKRIIKLVIHMMERIMVVERTPKEYEIQKQTTLIMLNRKTGCFENRKRSNKCIYII